jgi:hypothetical protein
MTTQIGTYECNAISRDMEIVKSIFLVQRPAKNFSNLFYICEIYKFCFGKPANLVKVSQILADQQIFRYLKYS